MTYQALYRKYRPKGFEDLIGQDHIKQTILNTLRSTRFSHAYLFNGPRGTGKTSIAKLIAKAINCLNLQDGEPCNQCANCVAANQNSLTDIFEMDAASNNGVEEIRSIRDDVQFAPQQGKYKVYIIDEVHMLSIGAFNALLKTLEEPPKHVIFILATTEPQKIPMTIISRCQRFDFKRISLRAMIERMKFIVTQEQLQVEEEALRLIAQIAQGGMRDALSLLDQTISFAGGLVKPEHVMSVVGKTSIHEIGTIITYIHSGKMKEVLTAVETIIEAGKEPDLFLDDLIGYYRDLLLYQLSYDETQLNTAIMNDSFLALSQSLHIEIIQKGIQELMDQKSILKWSNSAKTALEVAMVKLLTLNSGPQLPSMSIKQQKEGRDVPSKQVMRDENVLNNANEMGNAESNKPEKSIIKETILPAASKQYKNYLEEHWKEILVKTLSESRISYQLYSKGTIVLVSQKHAVICYSTIEQIEEARKEEYLSDLNKAIEQTIQVSLDFIFILDSEWKQIQKEYIEELRIQKMAQ